MQALYPDRIEISSDGFCGGRKTGEPGEALGKNPRSMDENPTTNSTTYGTGQAPGHIIFVGGGRSHRSAIFALHFELMNPSNNQ